MNLPKRRNPHREELVRKIALAVVSTFALFLALELGLRVFGFRHPPLSDSIIVWSLKEDKLMQEGKSLHQESTKQLWSPRPGAPVPWGEEEGETINPMGFRGPLVPTEQAEGVVRIAALGDSSTFGMGVRADQTYLAQLAELLSDRWTVETVNAGVIGHTLRQGIHRYEDLVRPLAPQLLIVAYGAVNDHLPTLDLADREKIAKRVAVTSLDRGLAWLRESFRTLHFTAFWRDLVLGVDRGEIRTELFEQLQERRKMAVAGGKVQWPGVRRMSVKRFRDGLLELAQLAREDDIPVVYLSMPRHPKKEEENPVMLEYTKSVTQFAGKRGAPMVDVRRLVYQAIEDGRTWEELFVDNYHPSPEGHRLIAEALAAQIESFMERRATEEKDPRAAAAAAEARARAGRAGGNRGGGAQRRNQ